MPRRSLTPMQQAARRLPWHVTLPDGAGGVVLDRLLAWCRRRVATEGWFYPVAGGDFAFLDRAMAEAFAVEVLRLAGAPAAIRDSRAVKAPPWVGKPGSR